VNFYFRANCNKKVGMGHLSRTLKLANELHCRKHKCFFFLDNKKDLEHIKIEYPIIEIYKNDKYINQKKDAKKFINLIKNFGEGNIVLDDYRHDFIWEKEIKKNTRNKVIVITDDVNKKHFADYIVNYKVSGHLIKEVCNPLNQKTKYLLGPKYSLIGTKIKKRIKKRQKTKLKIFKIILYLGGSGKINILENIASNIKTKFLEEGIKNFKIYLILGPLMEQKHILNKYKKQSKIKIISNQFDLINLYKKAHLFIGSAGTSIYETSISNIPTILFKYVKNQDDNVYDLEKLGHYICLSKKDFLNYRKLSNLVFIIKNNYKRYFNLSQNKKINLDLKGPQRICDIILNKKKMSSNSIDANYSKTQSRIFLKGDDSYINKVLDIRNLKNNRKISIDTKKINSLDHYMWWFQSINNHYYLKKNNSIKIIFWDSKIKLNNSRFIISGWYASQKINMIEVLNGINKHYKTLNKSLKLFSIVKLNNKISLMVNRYLGYKVINKDDKIYNSIKKLYTNNKHLVFSIK
tara:strand:+ start:1731 stop:3290 length:1560 start_codon:yes stop_codon:yes gene_type:complete